MQKQQAKRAPLAPATAKTAVVEEHDELDIIDQLDLADESPTIRLKNVLVDTNPSTEIASIEQLTSYIKDRLDNEHGEFLFDVGLEDNGDSMGFGKEQWDLALARLVKVTDGIAADCRVLMTRNAGRGHWMWGRGMGRIRRVRGN